MPKSKWKLNTIYISERLQESLRPISRCALTTVVAPMGYGKTTAVNWYLEERAKAGPLRVVRISVYSDNLAIFWRSAQDAFARAGIDLLREYACPTDAAGGGLLADDLCHELAGETPCYLFIDDFHLLTDQRVTAFLCMLAGRLPANVHLIIASRDRFLPAAEIVRLGARVYRLGTEQLRLNHTELAVYAHRCGTELSDAQAESLLYSSEGWFSAVYLNLRTLSEHGTLPERDSNIFTMFTAAMIEPLAQRQQEFLAVMGLADEFTAEMARFVTGDADAEELLAVLTAQNAFVRRLPDGVTYRFHHMMKECAERTFRTLDAETQRRCRERYGAWYEGRGQYLHAMAAYRRCGDYDALLRVVQEDAGILLASLPPSEVLAALDECPADALKAHPFALLVLMRSMFNWRNIPKMLELKALLLAALEEHPELPAEERGNLLGECDLTESIRVHGVLSPLLARPKGECYELVSGHRRRLAAQKLGLPTVPVLVREMTDDEAVILMVDSNLQRENLLPSEKAFAYKMKLEAMKRQGQRTDLTSPQVAAKLRTDDEIAKQAGISGDTVRRYIRLTNLVPPLLQMVDDGHIAFSPAVELSYLTRDEQAELWDLIGQEDATPSLSQALRMKQLSREAKLTPEVLYAILTEEKPNQKEQIRIKTESLRKYFPRNYSAQQMEREIIKLLEARYRAKDRGER